MDKLAQLAGSRTDIKILLVEDNPDDAVLVEESLSVAFSGQFVFTRVDSLAAAIQILSTAPADLVMLDLSLPDGQGFNTFLRLYRALPQVPIVILTGRNDEDLALRAVREGAQDYLMKSELQGSAVSRVIRYSIERKVTENRLKASEARYRELFENATDCIFMLDAEGCFISLNLACERVTGYKADELLGCRLMDILTFASVETMATVLSVSMSATEMIDYELEIVSKSGPTRILDLNSRPIFAGGTLIGIESFGRDVTERKRAEREAQLLSQRLEQQHYELTALYNATSILFQADSLTELLRQIAGVIDQAFGHEACQVILLDDAHVTNHIVYLHGKELGLTKPVPAAAVAEMLSTGANIGPGYVAGPQVDQFFASFDDSFRAKFLIPIKTLKRQVGFLLVASNKETIFDPQDMRLMRTLVAFSDRAAYAIENLLLNETLNRHIDEVEATVVRRTAEVSRIKEHIEAILNSSSDPIMLTDVDGFIMQINPAFERMFGYTSPEVFNQPLSMLVESTHIDALAQAVTAMIDHRQVEGVEVVYRRKDGHTRNGEIDLALLRTATAEAEQGGIVCVVHDITQHKQTQAGLHEALRRERELGELKTRFVSMVSHEFRTPLAVIQVASDLLRKYSGRMDEERRIEHYKNIQSQVAKLRDLLDDVLTISKAETVGLDFNPTEVDLPQFCWSLVEEIQPIANAHHFELQAPDVLPKVRVDVKLMRQAIMNLLSNAVKYSPAGSSIHVSFSHDPEQLTVQIRDEGMGIPEEDQERLFEVFHRAKNALEIQGSGLGLAIVKRAVEAHDGTITAQSALNVGTTFTIALPLTEVEPD